MVRRMHKRHQQRSKRSLGEIRKKKEFSLKEKRKGKGFCDEKVIREEISL